MKSPIFLSIINSSEEAVERTDSIRSGELGDIRESLKEEEEADDKGEWKNIQRNKLLPTSMIWVNMSLDINKIQAERTIC